MELILLNSCQAYLVLNQKIIGFNSSTISQEDQWLEVSFQKQKEPHQVIGCDKTGDDQTYK